MVMGGERHATPRHAPAALPPGNRPVTRCTRGCVSRSAKVREIFAPLGFYPRGRYTD